MRIRKTLLTALAMAIAIAFSPLPELQAATLGPSSQPGAGHLTQTVKMMKKKKKAAMKKAKKGKKKRKGKRSRSKAGKCGTFMYYSKKTRKCMDARSK